MITLKTSQKIALARWLSFLVLRLRRLRGLPAHGIFKRGGLLWDLDLTEGIDFSIYLLGSFEPRTVRLYSKLVKNGDSVLDIGANVGAHTLPLAQLVGSSGSVIAFEPTGYAVDKLRANLKLNPQLAERVSVCQTMLSDDPNASLANEVYSSWPLFEDQNQLHPQHGGRLMDTTGAVVLTLDQAMRDWNSRKITFIKLDVDGHEHTVLAGAREILQAQRPAILMEFSPYLYEANPDRFDGMLRMLTGLSYRLTDTDTRTDLPLKPELLRKLIPTGGTRNGLLQAC